MVHGAAGALGNPGRDQLVDHGICIAYRIASLYQDATQASMQQLLLSSTQIIQEHTLRAFMAAAQSCAEALAQNAMNVQQEAITRFSDANQQAMGMMGEAFADAWTAQSRTVH